MSFSGDCDMFGRVHSVSGPTTCTITNNDIASSTNSATSTLIVIKNVVNDNGGTATSSDFTLSLNNNGSTTSSFVGSSIGTTLVVNSGSYSVTEATSSTYNATFSTDCSGTMLGGETKTCTVINDDIATSTDSTPTPSITSFSSSSGGGGGTGFIKLPGLVLGASTDATSSCGTFLTTYMRMGMKNNPTDVSKLQQFLNQTVGTNIPVTGFFGPMTDKAVRAFQLKYPDQVLGPWVSAHLHPSVNVPTGYVYKTTLRWINLLKCSSLNIPVPPLP